jgi:GT2 family glycosyltransferase
MTERWGRRLLNDPYYSGHLSLSEPLFEKAEVSRVEPLVAATGQPRKFTALARDSRLDVYATADNERRVLEATRAVAAEACPEGSPGLSVVVLTKDRPDLIGRLVPELAAQGEAFHAEDLGYEVLIGDTGSTDHQVLELYRRLPPCARVTTGLEYNFSRCNNQLAAAAAFDTLLFLNNDVIFSGSTQQLIRGYHTLASDPGLGILGAVLHFPDGTIQHMGCEWLRETARWGLPYHVKARTRVPTRELPSLAHYPAVTGAFLLIGRSLFGHCGGFDPAYAAECQDAALCVEAARLGYEIACADLGHIIHIENGTRPTGEEHMADRQRFLRKAGAFIQASLS